MTVALVPGHARISSLVPDAFVLLRKFLQPGLSSASVIARRLDATTAPRSMPGVSRVKLSRVKSSQCLSTGVLYLHGIARDPWLQDFLQQKYSSATI
jgi:hypothetical protein